jgi:rhamnogalacturonyl hydrolase YesR
MANVENGAHENPNWGVVKTYLNSRMGPESQRSRNIEVSNPFKMCFNSASTIVDDKYSEHMRQLENWVKDKAQSSNDQMTFEFLQESSFEVSLT